MPSRSQIEAIAANGDFWDCRGGISRELAKLALKGMDAERMAVALEQMMEVDETFATTYPIRNVWELTSALEAYRGRPFFKGNI